MKKPFEDIIIDI